MTRISIVLLGSFLAAACGGGYEIADAPLSGKIGGNDWTFVTGFTLPALSDSESYWVDLYGEQVTECDSFANPQGGSAIVQIPTSGSGYDFSFSESMTLVDENSTNNIVTDGGLEITNRTSDTISGGLHGEFDADNTISGTFTIKICP